MEETGISQEQYTGVNVQLAQADENIDLSIIIVSYNTRDLTLKCVQSVRDASQNISAQIIVVDNQSSDGSSEALRSVFPDIIIIDSPVNGGFSFGNNVGLQQASGRFIMFLNPDTEIPKNFLDQALGIMKSDPEIGMLGPTIRNPDGSKEPSVMRDLKIHQFVLMTVIPYSVLRRLSILGDFRYASLNLNKRQIVDVISGCAMITRREIIEKIGGFDSRIFIYAEEMELCWRVRQGGWKVLFTPELEIMHLGGASTGKMNAWKAIELSRGHILYFRFTRGAFVAWVATLLMAIRDVIRTPYYATLFLRHGFALPKDAKPWWARLRFQLAALITQPEGQSIPLPHPDERNITHQ